ncbi:MAG: flagellar protein FlaG [Sporolactobacillus sp.]
MDVALVNPSTTVTGSDGLSLIQSTDTSAMSSTDPSCDTQKDQNTASKSQMKQMTALANQMLQPLQTQLQYVFFDKLDRYYVQVVNVKTHEVVREIPPKKELEFYAALQQQMGLLTNHQI